MSKSLDLANRIKAYIQASVPITTENGFKITIDNIKITIPEDNFDIDKQLQMKYFGEGSTEGYVSGTLKITDSFGRDIHKSNYKHLVKFPVATERGTYIVNGVEKNIISQMRMKPGCYTNMRDNGVIKTQLKFDKGNRAGIYVPDLVIMFDPIKNTMEVQIKVYNKTEKFDIVNFMSILGFGLADIRTALGTSYNADEILSAAPKKAKKTVDHLYKVFFPGTKATTSLSDTEKVAEIWKFLEGNATLGDGSVIGATLGVKASNPALNKEILMSAVKKTMSVGTGRVPEDVKDEVSFKDIYSDTDLIFEALSTGLSNLFENIKAKVSTQDGTAVGGRLLTQIGDVVQSPLNGSAGLFRSELCVSSEEINPLFMEAKSREISQGGPNGGMSKGTMENETVARNLTHLGMNKIDPVETPESGKIGFTQHLTIGAKIENHTIKSEFYKVVSGKALATPSNKVSLTPLEEDEAIVAFNDSRYVDYDGDKIVFTEGMVPGRNLGKTGMFPVSKIQYIDSKPQNVMGTSANMIPFVAHNDGARSLMGAAMQKQAVNLVNREVPLVTTLADKSTGQTFDQKLGEEQGRPVMSKANGTVVDITTSKIIVRDDNGKKVEHNYHFYYPLNQSYVNNELRVKVGDRVVEGQMLAEGWQTKDGKLSLGRNARIGYISYKGYNYEDGVVISESFAKAMTADEYDEVEILIPKNAVGGKGSGVKKQLLAQTTSSALNLLDNDGIIKEGTEIKAGSVLAGMLIKGDKDNDDPLSILEKAMGKSDVIYKERKVPEGSYVKGTIKRIVTIENPDADNKQKIVFSVVKQQPLKIGDKIAGRHGNKGIVSKILPDHLMPVAEDGKPLDLMMSPLAIPSRKNPGQLFEVAAGLIAEKTGKQFVVDNFNHREKDRVMKELESIGYKDGQMKITIKEEDEKGNVIDVPVENKITVGNMYVMKLKHKVDDKIQARSNYETPVSQKTHMPTKFVGTAAGEKSNPQRLGEMEMRALQAHGATWNILESSTIKSDGGGDGYSKAAIFKAISTGKLDGFDLSQSARPETVKVFADTLKILGLDVKPMYNGAEVSIDKPFNSLGVAPLNQKEFLDTVGHDKEVSVYRAYRARQYFDEMREKNQQAKREDRKAPKESKGGLVDLDIFGSGDEDEDRTKWGFIKLPIPTPNPLYMESASNNVYSQLTGLSKSDLKGLVGISNTKGSKAAPKAIILDPKEAIKSLSHINNEELKAGYVRQYVEDMQKHGFKPGDIVDLSVIDKLEGEGSLIPHKTGGAALEHILKGINVDAGLAEAEKELAEAKGSKIDSAYKKVKAFKMLKTNNMKPEDLMVKYVPVSPIYLRPIVPSADGKSVLVNDINKLYGEVITARNYAVNNAVLDESGMLGENSGIRGINMSQRSKLMYDALNKLHGNQVVKENDKKLTSVIETLSGKTGLIRKEMLAKRVDFSGRSVITVNPNLGLNEIGISLDMARQLYKPFIIKELISRGICKDRREAEGKLNKPDDEVKAVIQDVANDRPMFVNRQPSLHKYSIQAMKPVVKEYEDGGVVRTIQLNPLVVTGFNADFDGDTMAAHVPVTEKAKEEAKKLTMPYQNLINPTDGTMVIQIRHEMALGIYQLTNKWDKPEGKTISYTRLEDIKKDYLTGKIGARQKVRVPIHPQETTAGMAMVNWIIPDKLAKYRNFRQVWTAKKLNGMLTDIYRASEETEFKLISKLEISKLMDAIKDIGFKASTRTGVSLGTADFSFKPEAQKAISDILNKGLSDGATIEAWKKVEDEIEEKLKLGLLDDDNPLQIMMNSGARANAQQIRKMFATVGIGMDVTKTKVGPIQASHFEGLSPQEYFMLGKDSRKGMYDRSVSTALPGALTRNVWAAVQDISISEKDCGTREFISIKKTDGTVRGRFAGKDILSVDGKVLCKRNEMITHSIYERIHKDDSIEYVPVRSPLRCKTVNGKCQKCYGAMPGTMEVPKIGTAIGVIASQAIGEPVTQMTMNTFHTGGANSQATLGLPRVQSILDMNDKPMGTATLAKASGIIDNIAESPKETLVYIGKIKHAIPTINGRPQPLRVKLGDIVRKGDFLTVGDVKDIDAALSGADVTLTNAGPKDMYKLKASEVGQRQAINETRDYLAGTMQYAFQASNAYMDRKHSETIISKLTSIAKVTDSGDSPYMKGQKADVNLYDKWNKDNAGKRNTREMFTTDVTQTVGRFLMADVNIGNNTIYRSGELITPQIAAKLTDYKDKIKVSIKPIEYELEIQGQTSASTNDNWFSSLAGTRGVKDQLSSGSAYGHVDKLQDNRSRLMTGNMLNIGEGAELKNEFKDKMPAKMSNFFSNQMGEWMKKYKK